MWALYRSQRSLRRLARGGPLGVPYSCAASRALPESCGSRRCRKRPLPCLALLAVLRFAMSLRRAAGPLSRVLATCAPEAPALSGGASAARRWFASKGASADAEETVGACFACSRTALRGGGGTPQLLRWLCAGRAYGLTGGCDPLAYRRRALIFRRARRRPHGALLPHRERRASAAGPRLSSTPCPRGPLLTRRARGTQGGGAHVVLLDGRTLRTPARNPLALPSLPLALAVAAEWEWQEQRNLRPFTMPIMVRCAAAPARRESGATA